MSEQQGLAAAIEGALGDDDEAAVMWIAEARRLEACEAELVRTRAALIRAGVKLGELGIGALLTEEAQA